MAHIGNFELITDHSFQLEQIGNFPSAADTSLKTETLAEK